MKNLITAIFLLAAIVCKAQDPITPKEYDYITIGIKTQDETGADNLIKGYSIKYVTIVSTSEKNITRTTKFKAITREFDIKPFAFLCIYKNESTGFKDYICIPAISTDKDNWDKFYQIINEYDEPGKSALLYGIAHLTSYCSY